MGRRNQGRQRECGGVNSFTCCCGVGMTGKVGSCRPPALDYLRNHCLYYKRAILPVKFFNNVRKRNLRRIEPKENDDCELEDTKDEEGDNTESPVSKFAGKKRGKAKKDGSNNALSASSFGLLGEGDDEDDEDSGITKRMLIMKNQDNEVAGFAPCGEEEVGHPQERRSVKR